MTDAHDHTDDHPEPVTVGAFASVAEAEVAQAALRAFEVDSAVVDHEAGGAIPVDGEAIEVQVAWSDADAARDVLLD